MGAKYKSKLTSEGDLGSSMADDLINQAENYKMPEESDKEDPLIYNDTENKSFIGYDKQGNLLFKRQYGTPKVKDVSMNILPVNFRT